MIDPRTSRSRVNGRVNQATEVESGSNGTSPSSIGMFAVTRESATMMRVYRNGAQAAASSSSPSLPHADGSMRLGAISADSLRACQFCMGWIGGHLTADEMVSVYDWFQPYATELGIL